MLGSSLEDFLQLLVSWRLTYMCLFIKQVINLQLMFCVLKMYAGRYFPLCLPNSLALWLLIPPEPFLKWMLQTLKPAASASPENFRNWVFWILPQTYWVRNYRAFNKLPGNSGACQVCKPFSWRILQDWNFPMFPPPYSTISRLYPSYTVCRYKAKLLVM